jgi:hypothetical protein
VNPTGPRDARFDTEVESDLRVERALLAKELLVLAIIGLLFLVRQALV